MGTLSATADPGRAAILLAFTGATPGDRIERDGQPIRYPPISSAAGLVYDYEAQPGMEHHYTVSGATAVAMLPDTPGGTAVTLAHPTNPSLNQTVKVRDDNPNVWEAPGTVHEVMGQREPLVTHTMRTYHSGELVFWTPWEQRPDIIALFGDGTPILINPPASCPLEYEWTWGSLSAEKIDVHGQSGIWWTYSYQRVIKAGGYVTDPPTCRTPTSVSCPNRATPTTRPS